MTPENTFSEEYTLRNPHFNKTQKDEMVIASDKYKKAYVI